MNKILVIAAREFLETVRTKAFLIGALLMPGLIVAVTFGSSKLQKMAEKESLPTRRIAVIDEHGKVSAALQKLIDVYDQENPQRRIELEPAAGGDVAELTARIHNGALYGYILIPSEAVSSDAACSLARTDNQLTTGKLLSDFVHKAIVDVRMTDVEPETRQSLANAKSLMDRINRHTQLNEIDLASGKQVHTDEMARIMTPFIFAFLLYMGTFGISMGLLTSLLEEKSTRAIEMLLAAVSPMQLMTGKVLGVAAVGILTLGIWIGVGSVAGRNYLNGAVQLTQVVYLVLYFIPAFLLMSGMLAAVGSACNTLKEAQSMSSPLTILNVVPVMIGPMISLYPNSAFAVALSYIPPCTSIVMVLRVCADSNIPVWQIISTLVLLWTSVVVMFWGAARIFRIGILMYGKPPSLKELVRWTKYA